MNTQISLFFAFIRKNLKSMHPHPPEVACYFWGMGVIIGIFAGDAIFMRNLRVGYGFFGDFCGDQMMGFAQQPAICSG